MQVLEILLGNIQFFVSGMYDQAEEVLGQAKLLLDQYEAYQEEYETAPESLQRLIGVLFEQPYLTVPTVAERIDMSYPAANSAVDRLVDDGVLMQVEQKERNREFVATDVMEIVDRDATKLPSPSEVLE